MPTTLVTGASSGIGLAFARALAARGHDLVLVARRADRLRALATELEAAHGVTVQVLPADLTAPDAIDAIASALTHPLTGLVNNAGSCVYDDFATMAPEAIAGMITLNVRALTALTRRLRPSDFLLNVAYVLAEARRDESLGGLYAWGEGERDRCPSPISATQPRTAPALSSRFAGDRWPKIGA